MRTRSVFTRFSFYSYLFVSKPHLFQKCHAPSPSVTPGLKPDRYSYSAHKTATPLSTSATLHNERENQGRHHRGQRFGRPRHPGTSKRAQGDHAVWRALRCARLWTNRPRGLRAFGKTRAQPRHHAHQRQLPGKHMGAAGDGLHPRPRHHGLWLAARGLRTGSCGLPGPVYRQDDEERKHLSRRPAGISKGRLPPFHGFPVPSRAPKAVDPGGTRTSSGAPREGDGGDHRGAPVLQRGREHHVQVLGLPRHQHDHRAGGGAGEGGRPAVRRHCPAHRLRQLADGLGTRGRQAGARDDEGEQRASAAHSAGGHPEDRGQRLDSGHPGCQGNCQRICDGVSGPGPDNAHVGAHLFYCGPFPQS